MRYEVVRRVEYQTHDETDGWGDYCHVRNECLFTVEAETERVAQKVARSRLRELGFAHIRFSGRFPTFYVWGTE